MSQQKGKVSPSPADPGPSSKKVQTTKEPTFEEERKAFVHRDLEDLLTEKRTVSDQVNHSTRDLHHSHFRE